MRDTPKAVRRSSVSSYHGKLCQYPGFIRASKAKMEPIMGASVSTSVGGAVQPARGIDIIRQRYGYEMMPPVTEDRGHPYTPKTPNSLLYIACGAESHPDRFGTERW